MKIKKVKANLRAKQIEIATAQGKLFLPFAKLRVIPNVHDPIERIFIDEELANEAITYRLESGKEDSIHLDAFLEFNQDQSHMRKLLLHSLTTEATKRLKSSGLSKNQVIARLETSPTQLNRLLDPSFYGKTIDMMIKLLGILDCDVELKVKSRAA